MSSGPLSRFYKTLGFRLAFWSACYFILSVLLLSALAGTMLYSSLERQNRHALDLELKEYASQYEKEGLEGLQRMDELQRSLAYVPFYVRVAGPDNQTRFLSPHPSWEKYRVADLQREPIDQAKRPWRSLAGTGKGDDLDLASQILSDGSVLQIGTSSYDRHETLERFGDIFARASIPMILLAFLFGAWLTHRGLRPVKSLIERMNSVIRTGKMDVRFAARNTGDELDQLGLLFNRLLEKIELLIKGMKESLDSVAHDLRTPLTHLRGITEVALQSPKPTLASAQEALADCAEKAERVVTMLNTLMDISEAESGAMRLQRESVTLESVMMEVVELYSFVADEKNIRLECACPKDLLGSVDRNRLRQALANLIDNAVKYSGPGSTIRLEAFAEDTPSSRVVLRVSDQGTGIPPEELPHIWDRLYRGQSSRSQRGVGLGLSLVKAIIQAHDGTIEVVSTPGKGSLFTLFLPL